MDIKEFSAKLHKLLSEEIPLEFELFNNREDPIIRVYLPESLRFAFDKENCFIGMDDLKDKVEVYAQYGINGYENFGKVTDPQQVIRPIEEYLNKIYADVFQRVSVKDFVFSQDLHDFLEFNNIKNYLFFKGEPTIYVDHYEFPFHYTIEFSEYKDDVFVEVYSRFPDEGEMENNSDFTVYEKMYQSDLTVKNQQKVFSEILAVFRKEGFK